MTNELQTVGAMHQCRAGEPYSTCVHCGALAEALNKPCPHFMRDAAQKLAAVASPTPQADSQPAPVQDEREAFEAWWPSVGQTIGKVAAWEAWQARAPADSVTAPAGAGVAHALSDAQIEAMPVWRNFVGLWPESRREIVDAVVDLLTPPPAQAADSVLEDAARLLESQHTWITNAAAANLVRSFAARKQGANHD